MQLFSWLLIFAIFCTIIVLVANKFATHENAIGTIPAFLLLVLAATTAAGIKNMLERHVFVRNISDSEALGVVARR